MAYLGVDRPIQGRLGNDEVLVEFAVGSIDAGILYRQAVRHYRLQGGRAVRVDPLALGPRDFVEEWLTRDGAVNGEFIGPTMHCLTTPDLWQESIDFPSKRCYFLVRWRPPYHFTLVDVRDRPWAACTDEDPKADDESRTLFPH